MFAARQSTGDAAPAERHERASVPISPLGAMLNAGPRPMQLARLRGTLSGGRGVVQRMVEDERQPFIDAAHDQAVEAGFGPEEVEHYLVEARFLARVPSLTPEQAQHRLRIEFLRLTMLHDVEQRTQRHDAPRDIANGVAQVFGTSVEQIIDLYVAPFRDEAGALPNGFEAAVALWAESGARDIERTITNDIGRGVIAGEPNTRKYLDQLDRYISANIDFSRFYGRDDGDAAKYIHFIWSGRPISQGAIQNILQWAERAKDTPWQIIMWSDAEISDWTKSGNLLKRSKVKLMDVRGVLDPRFDKAYDFARKYNLAGASDLVRLSILKRQGGMYVDVDIGPGEIDLNATTLPGKMQRPKLAPGIRDAQGVRDLLRLPGQTPVTAEHVRAAARRQRGTGTANNNFISSAPNPMAINPVINQIAKSSGDLTEEGWANSGGFIAGISGPMAIGGVLDRMEKRGQMPKSDASDTITDLPLQWLTPDSEDQQWH